MFWVVAGLLKHQMCLVNKMKIHRLDHIVIGSNSLQEGTDFVEKKLGLSLSEIGYHENMGTHNRVIKICHNIYLEVIAIDPDSKSFANAKCFNLDKKKQQAKLKISPQIIGYVIENQNPEMLRLYSPFFEMSRGDYCWEFAFPKSDNNLINDKLIESGLVPSLIKWKSKKPISEMSDNHFELEKFQIELNQYQMEYKSYLELLGNINKFEYIVKDISDVMFMNEYPKFNIILRDKKKNCLIKL
jgi:hypothetical protein